MTTAADAALSDAVLTVFITSTAVLVHHSKEMSPQIAQSGVARIIFHRDLGSNCLTRRLLKNWPKEGAMRDSQLLKTVAEWCYLRLFQ